MKKLLTALLLVVAFSNIARAGEIDIGGLQAPAGYFWQMLSGLWSLISII